MNDGDPFKVLLYFDGTQHSFSATVYAVNLFNTIPNMFLTVLHVREDTEVSKSSDYHLMDIWSTASNSDWAKRLLEKVKSDHRSYYSEIIAKTSEIFSERKHAINQHSIYANSSILDTVEAIIDYTTTKNFELFIMGTRGLTSLKGLMFGSLAHSMLNKCDIPVLLIKKLPQEFINSFCATPSIKSPRIKGQSNHLHLVKTM